MCKRIFEIIEVANDGDKASTVYDFFMLFVIVVSLIPLAFKSGNTFFFILDTVAAAVFIGD